MAVAFAAIFLILGLLTFSSTAPELFANRVQVRVRACRVHAECVRSSVQRDEFVEVSKPVLTMALVLQPLKAMVGVYGPLIIAVQRYVAFGALVFVIFWCAFVPMTAVGAATGNLNTLIAAHVVYHALLLAGLIFVVHVQEIPRLRAKSKDGNAPGTSAAVVPVSSKLGGVKGSVSEA